MRSAAVRPSCRGSRQDPAGQRCYPAGQKLGWGLIAAIVRDDLGELPERDALLALDHGMRQPVEVREVVADRRPGDPGGAGDRVDRDPRVPPLEDHLEGGVDTL